MCTCVRLERVSRDRGDFLGREGKRAVKEGGMERTFVLLTKIWFGAWSQLLWQSALQCSPSIT